MLEASKTVVYEGIYAYALAEQRKISISRKVWERKRFSKFPRRWREILHTTGIEIALEEQKLLERTCWRYAMILEHAGTIWELV
ncbi:hypothetical protein ACROYT_G036749 [Oculina patagonica]